MENMLETPPKRPIQSDKSISDCKTPSPIQQTDENSPTFLNSGNDLRMTVIPDRLNVPKAFKYTERYTSPTDLMVSPVTKGLQARSRKGGALLPPSKNQLKAQHRFQYSFRSLLVQIQDMGFQDVSLLQN